MVEAVVVAVVELVSLVVRSRSIGCRRDDIRWSRTPVRWLVVGGGARRGGRSGDELRQDKTRQVQSGQDERLFV